MAIDGNGAAKITAVILDYGEVLCHRPSDEEFHRLAKVFGVDGKSFQKLWDKNRGAFDRGDLTAQAYWSALAEDAGADIGPEQIDRVCKWDVSMWGSANARMVAWLKRLREGGVKTALLSNMHHDMIDYLRENFDWIDQFDFITFSAEVRLIKPDAAIFEHTLRGLGVTPSETLFVDDREINTRAARKIGMHAVKFQSTAQLREELEAISFPILPVA
ncbi:MAG: HAD family phosphatase [Candidatus Sulfotelmatobacter sp.]